MSRQIIILSFLEHQRKLEQEKVGQRIKRKDIPKLSSIEKHTDVLNTERNLPPRKLDHLQPGISGRWGSVTTNRTACLRSKQYSVSCVAHGCV